MFNPLCTYIQKSIADSRIVLPLPNLTPRPVPVLYRIWVPIGAHTRLLVRYHPILPSFAFITEADIIRDGTAIGMGLYVVLQADPSLSGVINSSYDRVGSVHC